MFYRVPPCRRTCPPMSRQPPPPADCPATSARSAKITPIGTYVSGFQVRKRHKDIAVHDPRNGCGNKKMQTIKRGKGGEETGQDATRDALRVVRQTAHPMFDIQKRPSPTSTRPEKLRNRPMRRASVSAPEYQKIVPILRTEEARSYGVAFQAFPGGARPRRRRFQLPT